MNSLLNPKMARFVLALFPQFVRPSSGSVLAQMLVSVTIFNVAGFFVNGGMILVASRKFSFRPS
jgi:threonine/homoserine/homoserine lactone efflux protein